MSISVSAVQIDWLAGMPSFQPLAVSVAVQEQACIELAAEPVSNKKHHTVATCSNIYLAKMP